MFKFIPAFLGAIALVITPALIPTPTKAQPKYLATGKTIKSGQFVTLFVTNRTSQPVQVELPSYAGPFIVKPKQKLKFNFKLRKNDKGVSLLYWTDKGELPLRAKVAKPNTRTLQVELSPGNYYNDDRAIFDSEFNNTLFIF
jgi:hypothetical protein